MSIYDNPYSHQQDWSDENPDSCRKCGGNNSGAYCEAMCEDCEGDGNGKPCHECSCKPAYELESFEDYCGFCGGLYEEKKELEAYIKTLFHDEVRFCKCSRCYEY